MAVNAAWGKASRVIGKTVETTLKGIQKEVAARTYRASNELRNALIYTMRGDRSGKRYRVPGTKKYYTASAPGEVPAVRTGTFRNSWGTHVHVEQSGDKYRAVAAIESNVKTGDHLLGDILEYGTTQGKRKMKPRPYKQRVIDRAKPKIEQLYSKPYTV